MIFEVLARTALAVIVIILLVRINGLRSFAKMSSFEFALTNCDRIIAGQHDR